MAITTGAHPKALWPGVFRWFGLSYDEHEKEWTALFEQNTSKKQYEELVNSHGFGLAVRKDEGAPITFDTHSQGYIKRFVHVAYALGYIVTFEELRDNLYAELSKARAKALAFSMAQTKEITGANIYNRAFNSSYTGGDGKELLATDHPLMTGGTFSNELSVAADLSEAAIEELLIQIDGAVNDRNLKIALKGEQLIIPRQLRFEADRILKSTLQYDTANNTINALKASNSLPKGVTVNHYLTDADAWFVRTNCPNGMMMFQRDNVMFDKDNDFDTKNARASAYERYSFGWVDPRGLYGSAGA